MLLTSSLPLVPPPSSSLLPPVASSTDPSLSNNQHAHNHHHHHHHASRRQKPNANNNRNSTLALLSADERSIAQRKLAIAMYGYSWLKPAGCAKTMLGRREEELEREEVERQLREVELQERMEMEREEQERQARLAETGEPEGGRDLDADIPDMDDDDGGFDDQGDEEVGDEGEMEGMEEGDLDDEIPEADDQDLDLDDDGDETGDEDEDVMSPDPESGNGAWVYDSRREPDTDEETAELNPSSPGAVHTTGGGGPYRVRRSGHFRHGTAIVAGVRVPVPGSEYDYDEREAEDLANAMLDEDEIFDQDEEMEDDGERDLDDDVPEPESEHGWEHTDTELDESEMDISILPNQLQRESLGGVSGTSERMSGGLTSGRPHGRSSGPWISDRSPHVPSDSYISAQTRQQPGPSSSFLQPRPPSRATRVISGNRHQAYIATPETFDSPATNDSSSQHRSYHQDVNQDSPDPFTSTGAAIHPRYANFRAVRANAATAATAANHRLEMENATASNPNSNPGSSSRTGAARAWLDGAAAAVGGSARRTLFGRAARRGGMGNAGAGGSGSGSGNGNGGTTNPAIASNSSGGLFTPELSHIGNGAGEMGNDGWGDTPIGQGRGNGSVEGGHPAHRRVQSQNTNRRSGRFLTSRRRGEVDGQT